MSWDTSGSLAGVQCLVLGRALPTHLGKAPRAAFSVCAAMMDMYIHGTDLAVSQGHRLTSGLMESRGMAHFSEMLSIHIKSVTGLGTQVVVPTQQGRPFGAAVPRE